MTNIEPGNEMVQFKHRGKVVEVHQDFAFVCQELSKCLTALGFETKESRMNWVKLSLPPERGKQVTHVLDLSDDELLNLYEQASLIYDNRFPG